MISQQSYYTSYYNGSSFGALKYSYCSNNPVLFVDPNGEENVIYLVNLQGKDQAINPNKLIAKVNAQFEKMGLNTRMMLAPDGANFNPDKMDKTDSYVALGSAKAVKDFVKNKDMASYNDAIKYFTGGADNPEESTNEMGQKTRAIGMDPSGIKTRANLLGVDMYDFAALAVLHGAGHNANLNHSDELGARDGQTGSNAKIMNSGRSLQNNPGKFYQYLNPANNSKYISIMKQYFGTKPAVSNYYKK